MSKYYQTRADCDRGFPVDESLIEDPMRARRAACYQCVDAGNVFAATPQGDRIMLGCQQRLDTPPSQASVANLRTLGYGIAGYGLGAALTGYVLHGRGPGLSTTKMDWRQVAGGVVGMIGGVLLSKKK